MSRLCIVSSGATSLKNVARDIATVAQKRGKIVRLYVQRGYYEWRRIADELIIVMTASPTWASRYFLMLRDARKQLGGKAIFYATIEGSIKKYLVPTWVKRDCDFVACSNFVKEKLEEAGLRVTHVVHHGILFDKVEQITRLPKPSSSKVRFITVSTSHPRKGLSYLTQVIRRLAERRKDFEFTIITDEQGREYLYELPNTRISFDFGKYMHLEVLEMIYKHDYLVVPSFAEGFCLPVIEAMALGLPVIHARFPPLTEITDPENNIIVEVERIQNVDLEEGQVYHFNYYSIDDFAKALETAIDIKLSGEYEKRSQAVREHAKKFDAEKLYGRLLDILEYV